jgi:hypothetical protein
MHWRCSLLLLESPPRYAHGGAGELGHLIQIEEQGGIYWKNLWMGGSKGVD